MPRRHPLKPLLYALAPGLGAVAVGCGTGDGAAAQPRDAGVDGSANESVDAGHESAAETPESEASDAAGNDAAVACGVLPDGGTAPADAGDVLYSWTGAKQACFGEPFCQASCATSFLQALLDCEAVEGGYYWNFGSVYIRVAGRQGGSCVYDVGSEVEGGVTYKVCTAPMPVASWPGLRNVNGNSQTSIFEGLDGCIMMGSCSVQSGLGTPCDEGPAAVPTCPALPSHC